ncbi:MULTISPECIES: retron St85 family RNA-directed DNA polymerase [unclassified Duganella]|uniref:retron St85 family RNA-directed DNA polymerase n=1 Tax=unclassified Duganella TaxID=2636909 RepID=UPI0008897BC0|nr:MULTISPECIES: retron St85 family RNA-directed DNA polymerase [unclassified Duganella]SDH43861.1 Reverse transcriptase (RNA-dependent DNA polymerase) [Duganella sp. OV458]SDK58631.1 Reverse transcriptase (RNA-dependent DNA polymerase) [Duganella sp. OV510]
MSLRDRLEKSLPFSRKEIDLLVLSAPLRYKTYQIPKKTLGKFREVSQPTPEVKLLQRWLISNVFGDFAVHDAAKAYRNGIGLLQNVAPHKNHRYLLKLDFSNFFPSISSGHFFEFMDGKGYDHDDLIVMSRVFFKNYRKTASLRLAIGAPSSPALSNILLYDLDVAISNFCRNLDITYTRYADDLSFSTNTAEVLSEVEKNISKIIKENCIINLTLNEEKTVHASKKNGRKITGLTITSDNKISIGLQQKKLLRAKIDRYQKGLLTQDAIDSLKGYIAFVDSVEPEHLVRLTKRYGIEIMRQLYTRINLENNI